MKYYLSCHLVDLKTLSLLIFYPEPGFDTFEVVSQDSTTLSYLPSYGCFGSESEIRQCALIVDDDECFDSSLVASISCSSRGGKSDPYCSLCISLYLFCISMFVSVLFPPTKVYFACSYVSVPLCVDEPPPPSPPSPTPIRETTYPVAPPDEHLSAGTLAATITVLVVAILGVITGIFLGCYLIKRHQKKRLNQFHREANLQRSAVVFCQRELCHSVGALLTFSEYARYIGLNKLDFSGKCKKCVLGQCKI